MWGGGSHPFSHTLLVYWTELHILVTFRNLFYFPTLPNFIHEKDIFKRAYEYVTTLRTGLKHFAGRISQHYVRLRFRFAVYCSTLFKLSSDMALCPTSINQDWHAGTQRYNKYLLEHSKIVTAWNGFQVKIFSCPQSPVYQFLSRIFAQTHHVF
jgi:hypothetical protein